MTTPLLIKSLLALLLVLLLSAVSALAAPTHFNDISVVWYSVLPPLIAISLALITRRIVLSLLISVIVGGLLTSVYYDTSILMGAIAGPEFIWKNITDIWNIQVILFLVLVLSMIAIIITAGGLQGIIAWLSRYAKNRRSSQLVTALMGILIFIDDYANTMIVGTAMRPMTDHYQISREKLAFLVDATSAPISGIAFISTWIAYEVGQFGKVAQTLGIERDGYSIFFDIFTFRFYCLLMLAFVFFNILSRLEFGSMAKAEHRAVHRGQVSAPDAKPMTTAGFAEAEPDTSAQINILAALIPLGGLFLYLLAGLWVDGGGLHVLAQQPFALFSFTAWRDVISHSQNNISVLVQGSLVGILLAIICARSISKISWHKIGKAFLAGLRAARLPIIILVMAWSLKSTADALHTDVFLVSILGDNLPAFTFPLIIFVLAGITAIATGTSWGTMAILIPIAAPIALQLDGGTYGLITMITLAAVLDGSIFGDHCSPLSDTTIMSSIASSCDYTHHIRTQFPYALLVGLVAIACGYLPTSLGLPGWVAYGFAALIMFAVFTLLGRRSARRYPLVTSS